MGCWVLQYLDFNVYKSSFLIGLPQACALSWLGAGLAGGEETSHTHTNNKGICRAIPTRKKLLN